jgi:hypothetical protein
MPNWTRSGSLEGEADLMGRRAGTPYRRRARTWRLLIGTVGALSLVATGCSTHDVSATRTCTTVTNGKVVAISSRGAIGMAKIGLTPKALKLQEKCK